MGLHGPTGTCIPVASVPQIYVPPVQALWYAQVYMYYILHYYY